MNTIRIDHLALFSLALAAAAGAVRFLLFSRRASPVLGDPVDRSAVCLIGGLVVLCFSFVPFALASRFSFRGSLVLALGTSAVLTGAAAAARTRAGGKRGTAGPGAKPASRGNMTADVAFLFVLAAGASYLFNPPFETWLEGSDASAYLVSGAHQAASGEIPLTDPALAALAPDEREAWFGNRVEPYSKAFIRFTGGYQIADPSEPVATPSFLPIYPAWIAAVTSIFGPAGAPWVAFGSAILGVLVLALLGRALDSRALGWIAALFLLANAIQQWHARFPLSEAFTQLFTMSGLYLFVLARKGRSNALAFLAGAALGIVCLSRLEMIPFLGIALAAVPVLGGLEEGERRPSLSLVAGYLLGAILAGAYLARFPGHYSVVVRQMFAAAARRRATGGAPIAGVVALVLIAGAAIGAVLLRSRQGPAAALPRSRSIAIPASRAVPALLVLGWLAFYWTSRPCITPSVLAILGAFLPAPLWVLSILGLAGALARGGRGGDANRRSWLFLAAAFVLTAAQLLYYPLSRLELMFLTRRFVPLFLPLLCLFAARGALAIARARSAGPHARPLAILLCASVLVASAGKGSALIGKRFYAHTLDAAGSVAALLPSNAVVLIENSLASTHLGPALTYTFHRPAIELQEEAPPAGGLDGLMKALPDAPVLLAVSAGQVRLDPARFHLVPAGSASIEFDALEHTAIRRPARIELREIPVRLFRIERGAVPSQAPKDGAPPRWAIGDFASSWSILGEGFYATESEARPGEPPIAYRWTAPEFTVRVPRGATLRLRLDANRPRGLAPARITISVAGESIARDRPLNPGWQVIEMPIPPGDGEVADVRASVPPFHPNESGASTEDRALGVRLEWVEVD